MHSGQLKAQCCYLRAGAFGHRVSLDFTMLPTGCRTRCLLVCLLSTLFASAQQSENDSRPLVQSGQVTVDGHAVAYLVRYLPVNSFPDLPQKVADQLNRRGCLIPQSYAAHHPENVVNASLEGNGSSDWAVLCSAEGTVSLLVFFASAPGSPMVLSSAPETRRLGRHDLTGVLGFNWAIDQASPEALQQVRNLDPRPAAIDHDALADSVVDRRTVYRFYNQHAWTVMTGSE